MFERRSKMASFITYLVFTILFIHNEFHGVRVNGMFFKTPENTGQSEESYNGTCVYDGNLVVTCILLNNTSIGKLLENIPQNTTTLKIKNAEFVTNVSEKKWIQPLSNGNHLMVHNSKINIHDENYITTTPKIQRLYLSHLNLTDFDFSEIQSLTSLEALDLSHNTLRNIPENAFETLQELMILDLSHNELTSLSNYRVFHSLISLVSLNLSHNHLSYIHPRIFYNLKELEFLQLDYNNLTSMQYETFTNMSEKTSVSLGHNPWNCHCGIEWIVEEIQYDTKHFSDVDSIVCNSPASLQLLKLFDLNTSVLLCDEPSFGSVLPQNLTIHFMQSDYLHCVANGHPEPSIYWIGPRGILVHPSQQKWLPHDVHEFSSVQMWAGQPTYFNATVTALANGSLHFHNFRYNFDGSYKCVAVNPAGNVSISASVHVNTHMVYHLIWSVLFGGFCGTIMLIIGIAIGSSYWIAERTCCKKDPEESAIEHYYSEDIPEDTEGYWDSYFRFLPYEYPDPTSRQSPMKCVTPAELLEAEESRSAADAGIWQTLDEARTSLRTTIERQMEWVRSQRDTVRDSSRQLKTNVGKKVDRVKYKAHMIQQSSSSYVHSIRESGSTKLQSIKESSSVKLQSIRETGTTKLKTIRSSSSHYAFRMKSGMADRVEAVRGQVKSLKEFCGTGDLNQTVSVMSVSTNVDSQEQCVEYKSHTLV